MKEQKTVFQTLSTIDVSKFTKVLKTGYSSLSYLSWADAWKHLKKAYPQATFRIVKDSDTNLPYVGSDVGAMVFTEMTIDGVTHEMWLPVMDNNNKAMKKDSYTYTTKKGDRTVQAMTMFDVNTAIMRCLTKNMAMFGLGLNIYTGEDLPMTDDDFLSDDDLATIQQEETDRLQKFNELTAKYVVSVSETINDNDQAGLEEILAELASDLSLKQSVWKKLTPDQQRTILDLKKPKQAEVEKKELLEEAVA